MSSYHDLHITTSFIQRTSIFNLPFSLEVTCSRVAGCRLLPVVFHAMVVYRSGHPVLNRTSGVRLPVVAPG